ncbi:MAG TPA: N-acetylmuramic acid 6-phosphate etherase [Gaiellaceae bacterium]|nr:N-acetylmuramic acid 6-phosphate etherase [Gaiellaceae bacterium]
MVEDELITEAGSDPHAGYESRPTSELVELMNAEDASVPEAVRAAAPAIAEAIDAIADRMRAGGRLVYVGAGSSGLIAALDASECEATFSTPPGLVVALVAGDAGAAPLTRAVAEDDGEAGARDVGDLTIRPTDVVVGISASGSTPYVLGALDAAVTAGALTVCVVCAPGSTLGALVDHEIVVVVGPEFIAGSTRLKAGTAQKLVLNAISTITMIRLGKTYGNLMVDVVAANEKLVERVRRIVAAATGATRDEIDEALAAANGDVRVAIVCLVAGVDADTARARLEVSGRSIGEALEELA